MAYLGRYINMDASVERRRALEAQFARLGCADRYQRFPGVDGRRLERGQATILPGELGCFTSHFRCLQQTLAEDAHVHVVEDDVVFGPRSLPILEMGLEDVFADFEMLFTDVFVPGDMNTLLALMNGYRASGMLDRAPGAPPAQPRFLTYLDLQHASFAATASYVVRKDARPKLLALMEAELAQGATAPIDVFFKTIVADGRIRAACTVPFLTAVDVASATGSTIEDRGQHRRSALAFFLLRNYFYIDKDEAMLKSLADGLGADLPDPGFMDTLVAAFKFIFSGQFEPF
ncbi:MAG: glycosyltransferase family 25 protein [Caulobacteraceae bacterium]|nr:glycosyltransferase family 25 protein [Caulobacteraceae bacterium]